MCAKSNLSTLESEAVQTLCIFERAHGCSCPPKSAQSVFVHSRTPLASRHKVHHQTVQSNQLMLSQIQKWFDEDLDQSCFLNTVLPRR